MKGFIKFIKELFEERTDKDGYPIKGYDYFGDPIYKDENNKPPQKPICKKCGQELSLIDTKDAMGIDVERLICQRCWMPIPSRRNIDD